MLLAALIALTLLALARNAAAVCVSAVTTAVCQQASGTPVVSLTVGSELNPFLLLICADS